MTKGLKVLTTVLIVLVGLLASSTGFFYAKTTTLDKQLKSASDESTGDEVELELPTKTETTDKSEVKDTDTAAETDTKTTTTTTTKPASTTTTTSTTGKKYTVVAGDTMFSIAQDQGVNWLDLAKANGLDENTANKIKIGQVLIVPEK